MGVYDYTPVAKIGETDCKVSIASCASTDCKVRIARCAWFRA